MQINSIYGADEVYSGEDTIYSKKKSQEESNSLLSWQPDNVNISDEARAAYAAMLQEEKSSEESSPDDEFAEYMKEARGENASAGDPQKQIEKLEKQLEKLQSKLAELAESNTPEDAKQAQMGALHAEIGAISAQIAELKTPVEDQA